MPFFLITLLFISISSQAQELERLKKPINTRYNVEYAPFISVNENILIFESNRKLDKKYDWKLFYCLKNDAGEWSEPRPIEAVNNLGAEQAFIAGPALNASADTLYFTAAFQDSTQNQEIYFALKENETWTNPQRLTSDINSANYEGFPSISADGKIMYFVRQNELIYASADSSVLEGNVVNKKYNQVDYIEEKNTVLEDELCFTIYASEKQTNGSWGKPYPLSSVINEGCEKAPRILNDNVTLVFSSARDGGKGGFDLYVSVKDVYGNWSEPIILEMLNSVNDDLFVTLIETEDKLYFNTDRKRSFDIYEFSPIPEELKLQYPVLVEGTISDSLSGELLTSNLKVFTQEKPDFIIQEINTKNGQFQIPLRTGYDYIFEVVAEDEKYKNYQGDLNLSAQTPEKGAKIQKDILLTPKTSENPLIVQIIDAQSKEPIASGEVVLRNITQEDIDITLSEGFKEGIYENILSPKQLYLITFKSDNYQIYQDTLSTQDLITGVKIEKQVALNPLTAIDKTFEAARNKINFATNSARLKETSYDDLDNIYEILKDNSELKLEIIGHTDNVGEADYNLQLSIQRAKAVKNYFIQKGISADRLVEKGYGETKPLVSNDSKANRKINRRVEFKVVNN